MMATPTEKILMLPKILKSIGYIDYEYEFYDAIGVDKTNLDKYRKGNMDFSIVHLKNIALIYNIDANYILGITERIHLKNTTEISVHKKVHKSI